MSTPTEVKAQAIALLTLGHSCREVERELRRQFPRARIPHFSKISRWLQKAGAAKGKAAEVRWLFVLDRAGQIAHSRVDEMEGMSLVQLLNVNSLAWDMCVALRQASGERPPALS